MDYPIVLSKTLNVSVDDFVQAWNAGVDTQQVAVAENRALDQPAATFGLEEQVAAVLTGVSGSIVAAYLYDLIKGSLARKGVTRETEIIEVQQPDGTKILIVKERETRHDDDLDP